ncbi:hypothetical protein CTAYLR_005235 [Chrysophaeum taylorii]|uniref:ATP-dependent (S)-NAD(P)H-hydrate dehydratase n=1 Tax=Chrysophaeum taylorii TaxID=2483200 RepID=A0AAD7UDL1_9STRA|nr:hypothetical protein CTAYLR_005235 [Chrysophaeum taylorii]
MFRAAALVMLQGSRSEAASTLAHGAVAVPWRSGAAVVQSLVPSLSYSKHKGQAGRIGVVGGSLEYTGAPYYAAASTLQLGADLSWVFAAHEAAIPIKSYSPELIVLPTYKSEMDEASVRSTLVATVEPWLDRLHGLVVGPGLGRRSSVMDGVSRLVEIAARERRMPVVVDADGLFLVAQRPELVTGCPNVMLTPNAPEFERLKRRVLKRVGERSGPDADAKDLVDVCRALGGVTVVKKGRVDLISDGRAILAVDEVRCV